MSLTYNVCVLYLENNDFKYYFLGSFLTPRKILKLTAYIYIQKIDRPLIPHEISKTTGCIKIKFGRDMMIVCS